VSDKIKVQIGGRMKAAAKEAGLGAEDVAERLGCSVQTVYGWWSGSRQPDLTTLSRYAQAVGKEPGWFFDPERKRSETAVDLVMRIVWLTMEGHDLADATEQLVNGRGTRLSPRDRRTISAGTEWVRDQFTRRPEWASLPVEEQMRLLRQVLETVLHEE
jgi:transcriptional regulator with XRE-family HTH domain